MTNAQRTRDRAESCYGDMSPSDNAMFWAALYVGDRVAELTQAVHDGKRDTAPIVVLIEQACDHIRDGNSHKAAGILDDLLGRLGGE